MESATTKSTALTTKELHRRARRAAELIFLLGALSPARAGALLRDGRSDLAALGARRMVRYD